MIDYEKEIPTLPRADIDVTVSDTPITGGKNVYAVDEWNWGYYEIQTGLVFPLGEHAGEIPTWLPPFMCPPSNTINLAKGFFITETNRKKREAQRSLNTRATRLAEEAAKKIRESATKIRERLSSIASGVGGILVNFARAAADALDNAGARHDYRLALAGFMVSSGVTSGLLTRTLEVCGGNPEDALYAAESTIRNFNCNQRVTGYGKIRKLVGAKAARRIKAALQADLVQLGVDEAEATQATAYEISGYTAEDREWIELHATFAEEKQSEARAVLEESSNCGFFSKERECQAHGTVGVVPLVCKREVACPNCWKTRAACYEHWIWEMEKWPGEVVVARLDAESGPASTIVDRVKALRYKTTISPEIPRRWVLGDGYALLITPAEFELMNVLKHVKNNVHPDAKIVKSYEAGEMIVEALGSINKAFVDKVKGRDPELYKFPWLQRHIKRTSANKAGKAALPWPKGPEINLIAKDMRRSMTRERDNYGLAEDQCGRPIDPDPETGEARLCPRVVVNITKFTPLNIVVQAGGHCGFKRAHRKTRELLGTFKTAEFARIHSQSKVPAACPA